MRTSFCTVLLAVFCLNSLSVADDWPQRMGPERDGVWREEGIVDAFPNQGLPVKWRAKIHAGYGGPAVVGDRVYVMDYLVESGEVTNSPGGRTKLNGQERLVCFSAKTGQQLWASGYDRPYNLSYAGGPRCTPTIADGKVYTLGAEGNLVCFDAESGRVIWERDLPVEYETETPILGYASHPLEQGS